MAVALDPHPRYRVFYSIIVIQLQQEQKYNDKAVRSETPPSTGVRRIQSMRHFRAPQFSLLELTAKSFIIKLLLIRQNYQRQEDARRFETIDGCGVVPLLLS
jgi:hypothetical protein